MNVLDRPLVEAVAHRLSTAPGLIGKDWHVTRALTVLDGHDHGGFVPALGVGTSLSKGRGLIKRFGSLPERLPGRQDLAAACRSALLSQGPA